MLAAPAGAAPVAAAPLEASILAVEPAEIDAIAARLVGQRFTIAADRRAITIDDIAGEGRPWVGIVERRGDALLLVTAAGDLTLRGPLARPRIAGPGYAVWVIGERSEEGLTVRRIGVLRRPR